MRGSPMAISSGHQEGAKGCKMQTFATSAGVASGTCAVPERSATSLSPLAIAAAHSANRRRASPYCRIGGTRAGDGSS